MGLAAKRRVLFGVVVAVLAWPALHHAAVRRFGIDPWMFFGLSMYTRPRPIVTVTEVAVGWQKGGRLAPVTRAMLGKEAEAKARRLEEATGAIALAWVAYGTLAHLEQPVAPLFDVFPAARRIRVRMRIDALDANAVLVMRLLDIDCARAPAMPIRCATTAPDV